MLFRSQRLLFRSRHIYLLLGALINLGIGVYYVPAAPGWRRGVQGFSSALVLSAPPLLLAAFIDEPHRGLFEGQLARISLFALLAGVLLQALAAPRGR